MGNEWKVRGSVAWYRALEGLREARDLLVRLGLRRAEGLGDRGRVVVPGGRLAELRERGLRRSKEKMN